MLHGATLTVDYNHFQIEVNQPAKQLSSEPLSYPDIQLFNQPTTQSAIRSPSLLPSRYLVTKSVSHTDSLLASLLVLQLVTQLPTSQPATMSLLVMLVSYVGVYIFMFVFVIYSLICCLFQTFPTIF